jgi:methionyl-tRNA synthetase
VSRPAIVIAATPTSNGDLHVGHMAGPYLSGDIYARYLAATGRPVIYTTCTDDSQSYVVTTAHRRGVRPEKLVTASTEAIERSMRAIGLSMVGLPPIDEVYRQTVLRFVTDLHAAGRFQLRTVKLPYAQQAGTYLYDGLVTGTCPSCLGGSCGGACEGCGHPNNYDELIDPRSTVDPGDPVEYREATILVLPMEDYRERLTAYYAAREGRWRPHAMQLIHELLARPLPEIPITIPGTWGIPAPFPETPGQVLYPWIEAMPASIYSTWWSALRLHLATPQAKVDELWLASSGAELVYFHGFDNVYHWGLMDLVLLMAHGQRYITPESNICNEFYDLEGEKFSTSRNHLIWSTDLLAEVPRDLVRFHLALTAPEFQRTNFSTDALRSTMARRLVEPWNALADAVTAISAHERKPSLAPAAENQTPGAFTRPSAAALPTTAAGRERASAMAARLRLCYELPAFSAARTAETVLAQLTRLRASAGGPVVPGDLLLEVRTLLAYAAPILIDTADAARADGIDLGLSGSDATEVHPFELPKLPGLEPGPVSGDVRPGRHRHSQGEALSGGVR